MIDAAYNKSDAIEKINASQPNLKTLDIMMDEIDNKFSICQSIKHDLELKSIPVLALSAITEKTGLRFLPKYDKDFFNPDDYVQKPIETQDLIERVE